MNDWTDNDILLDTLLHRRMVNQRMRRRAKCFIACVDHALKIIDAQVDWAVAYIDISDALQVLKK